MKLKDVKSDLREGKRVVITGAALLCFAAFLFLVVTHFSAVWSWIRILISALYPAFCGLILAFILNVFVHFFEDIAFKPFSKFQGKAWKKVKRPLAVVLAYLVVLLVILFVACFVIPGLIESMSLLGETVQKTLPGTVNAVVKWVMDFAARNDLAFLQDFIKGFNWSSLLSNVTKMTGDFVGSLVGVTVNVASAVFTLVMGFIFSIYMLFGKEKLLRGVRSTVLAFLPEQAARKLGEIGSLTNQVFFSFVRGQLTECVILGSLCYIGMSLLGLDYALLISSIVALGALIPILGAYIGCVSGVVILLLVHPIDALIFLVFLLCLQQVEGNLIYPRVVGSSIGLPPIWTLFAVLFCGGVLGIPGILIGTPAMAVLYRLLRTSVHNRLREKGINPADPRLSAPAEKAEENTPEKAEEAGLN